MRRIRSKYYPKTEEKLNVITHGIGFLMSLAALTLLIVFASLKGSVWHIVSFAVYGTTMVILYFASTVFHLAQNQQLRNRLNIFDHAAIYLLIAGTYTPFALVTLRGPWGWTIFGVIWGLAIAGIVIKLFFTGRFNLISTVIYVLMGWIIVIAIKPLVAALPFEGLMWLLAGGIIYTAGAVLFLLNKLPYNHAIFHVFVVLASFCHFVAVFWYVLD